MSLLKKSDALLDLLKADAPKPPESPQAPSAPASSGGGGGGAPAGSEGRKRGGKYIRRWWTGDHWEYEYQDSPHPTAHGVEDSWQDEHTMEALPGNAHADPATAYQQAMEGGSHHETGYTGQTTNPVTGQRYEVKLSGVLKNKDGSTYRKIALTPVTAEGEKRDPATKRRVQDASKHKSQILTKKTGEGTHEVWNSVNQWFKAQAAVQEAQAKNQISKTSVESPDGKTHAIVLRAETSYDPKSHKLAETSQNWVLMFSKDSELAKFFHKKGATTGLRYKTPQAVDAKARQLQGYLDRMHEESMNPKTPAAQAMAAGQSATDLLTAGQVPFGGIMGAGKGKKDRFGNDWGSPEARAQAIEQVKEQFGDAISAAAAESNASEEAVNGAVEFAVDKYSPVTHKATLEKFVADKVKARASWEAHRTIGAGDVGDAGLAAAASELSADEFSEIDFDGMRETLPPSQELEQFVHSQRSNIENFKEQEPQLAKIADMFSQILEEKVATARINDNAVSADEDLRDALKPLYDFGQQLTAAFKNQPEQLVKIREGLLGEAPDVGKSMKKAIAMAKALAAVEFEENLEKANFTYSHKEGNDMYPKYMYKDEYGNYSSRANAPKGHSDYDSAFGDAEDDDFGPETAPQFFTPDGRKMSRAPYTDADVQWNPNYHRNDQQNLWAARWVNPVTGEHEYAYIDSDLRDNSQYKINRQNALTDNRLPHFRQYVAALFKSVHQKDKTVAVILALLDQGRFRVRELMALRVGDVQMNREVLTIGRRKVHGDPNLVQHLGTLTSNRHPMEPLFAVAPVGVNGDMDHAKMRRIGPHFVVNLLEEVGVSAESLQTYHASQTYSMEMQRIFGSHNVGYGAAHHFALLEVASEMGHNLDNVEDFESAIYAIEQAAIDPVVVQAIKVTCEKMGIGASGEQMLRRPVFDSIPHVSMVLTGRTPDEEEFSRWLRMVPLHNFPGQEVKNEIATNQM